MANLSRSALRLRLAAGVSALSGWTELRSPLHEFPSDPSAILHQGFTITVGRTVPAAGRQRVADGVQVSTDISVRFAIKVRPKEQITSLADALDAQAEALRAIMGASRIALGIHLVEIGAPEIHRSGEWIFAAVNFECSHHLALT